MPNEKLGVYVLENLDHAEIRHGLMYSVFDLYNGGRGRDWSADLKPLFERRPAQAGNAATQRTTSPPSLPLERYAGTYVDSAYGEIRVTFENGALQAALVTDPPTALQPLNMEAFRAQPAEAGRNPATLVFQPDGAGGVVSVRVSGITFTKVRR
jgi:hypothetical protein